MWKGLLKILTAIVHGLGASLAATSGNMCTASAFRALEMAHTHYWTRLELGDNDPSDPSKVERGSEVAEVTSSTLSTPVASSTVRATAKWIIGGGTFVESLVTVIALWCWDGSELSLLPLLLF